MVLPPSAANDAPGPDTPGWLRRLKVSLGLSRAGLLVLVDHARPERLGELVRTLYPLAPELEVHTDARQLTEARPGSTQILVPRAEDADWLNINRPLFASRALRVVLFCTREVSVALSRRAVDFLDWISLRLECPAGPAPHAVAGLRCALAARVPGIVWTGGDLEASFAAARPHRELRRLSAARPYEELVAEVKASGPGEWLAWTEVEGEFRLRRVRWALAEAGRRTRVILVEPSVRSPGWWEVHGRVAELGTARESLKRAGAEFPGRLAALVDLEPEALQLMGGLLERGVSEHALEEELLKEADPGASVGRLATAQGLVQEKERVRGRAPPPAMRAFGAERSRMRLLHGAELDAIEQRASRGEQLHAEDVAWWSAWVGTLPSQERLNGFGERGEVAEALLRHVPRTSQEWEESAATALSVKDLDVAHVWAQHAFEANPKAWKILSQVLSKQGQFAEAESLFRRHLEANEQISIKERGWILYALGEILHQQGRYAEAESLLRQSLDLNKQEFGSHHLSYAASLHELASVLNKQGQYIESEELLRKSLAIKEQILGNHHPNYGASLHELASVLQSQGQYTNAEELLRQSLSIAGQMLGPHHPNYVASLQLLGNVLERQGRYTEAEELLRQSLAIQEQTLGLQHPDYGVSLHQLALVLQQQGQFAEAEQLLRRSLAINEQALGPRNPRLSPTLANLGFNLATQGRVQEGEPFLLRSFDIAREAWGTQHPETATTLNLLARVQAALKKPEAITTAHQAIDALLHTLGPEHPITKDSLPGLRRILAGSE